MSARLCHAEIRIERIDHQTWRHVLCNRPEDHPGRCSPRGDCHTCTGSRVQGHRGECS